MEIIKFGYLKWKQLSYFNFILSTTLIIIISLLPIGFIFDYFNITEEEVGGIDADSYSTIGLILSAVVFAPLMETLFLQTLPIKLLQGLLKNKYELLIILFSSLLFSLMHFGYSYWYSLLTLPTGIILAKTYILFQERKESSFWTTTAIHSLRNLVAVVFILLEAL
ncbi:hypothetical protein BC962_3295 [Gillisia mitskevichiae]|uniref:CAAX prenyl protease 2/Lysostaphin resistance protein A-like domain-containing protein n=1 Tax=Gillisia mitskevichiae TaxID=270921 RepID=A0A495NVJ9_9FLAO|nr:CPBP family glutamic-type intramembrane protease [Gillisia mitskevichiae]RKS42481.1 hypothetical protein BC962_3295 [Gillisia mitskevichiae]